MKIFRACLGFPYIPYIRSAAKYFKQVLKFILIFLILLAFGNKAFASISISISGAENSKTKILFLGFEPTDQRLAKDASEILEHVKKNLKTTDLFEIIQQPATIQIEKNSDANLVKNSAIEILPDFEKHEKAGIGAIIVGQFNYDPVGNLETQVRMWDIIDRKQLFGKFYASSHDNYRKVANVIADEIFKAITGEQIGHFTSKILYASEVGSARKRIKKINIIDFDGSNHRELTDGRDLALTPIFSKKRDEIFYLRYFDNKPQIFSLDIKNMRTKKIGGFRGTTFAPSINPNDPDSILLSAIVNGNSDIYELNISNNSAKRLTKSPAIDTTPNYSPDGKLIAFASDRDSGQQLYVMDSEGSSVMRISSGSGSYSKPVWSPDGRMIAFTKIKGGEFFIGIMMPNGTGEKLLTSAYLAEGARWSPNGRYLIFSRKKVRYGKDSISRLCIIDIVTKFEYELPTPEDEGATDPDWI